MYQANVVKVMIASPGDVATERKVLRQLIHDWNDVHSEDREVVLMPIGWETHSYPEMGERPQGIINRQILENCDLLVAVLWTRIGTPTGGSVSGTVEEIEKHVEAGKPAMIYFSSQPVHPDSVDDEQYRAVKEFKEVCKEKGLIETYESISEFKNKVFRQLHQLLTNYELVNQSTSLEPVTNPEDRIAQHLGTEARQLLTEVAADSSGAIIKTLTHDGLSVQTNGKQLVANRRDPRNCAVWEAAVQELCEAGLVEERGQRGEVFQITNQGYSVADNITA